MENDPVSDVRVTYEVDGALAVITIDRPHARNAISLGTMDLLNAALDEVNASSAKALVITGAGDKAFVSGGDLKELAALRTEDAAADMARRMRNICDRIASFPGPVIAALNGHALGGGAEFSVSADIRVACDDIRIGFNQVTLAIMPAWGGAERLATLVGKGRALMLAGSGRILQAAEAERFGLLDVVVPRASFEDEWRSLATKLATGAADEIKRIIAGVTPEEAISAFAKLWVHDDHWAAADKVMARVSKG